eukprot:1018850-Pyramimonas_sp.AAC.1
MGSSTSKLASRSAKKFQRFKRSSTTSPDSRATISDAEVTPSSPTNSPPGWAAPSFVREQRTTVMCVFDGDDAIDESLDFHRVLQKSRAGSLEHNAHEE